MPDKLTYAQQTQRILILERKLTHMTSKEAALAVRLAELEEQNTRLAFDSGDYRDLLNSRSELARWAYDLYIAYRDTYGWKETETDHHVLTRPNAIRQLELQD